jgi:hypothetical protein
VVLVGSYHTIFTVTPAQKKQIVDTAQSLGMSTSRLVRSVLEWAETSPDYRPYADSTAPKKWVRNKKEYKSRITVNLTEEQNMFLADSAHHLRLTKADSFLGILEAWKVWNM